MSSSISCPVFVFIPMCPNESFQLVGFKSHTSFASPDQVASTRWTPIGHPEHWHSLSSQVSKYSWRSASTAPTSARTKADWRWSREFMLQQVLLPCQALPDINHRQQQPKEQPLGRHHSQNSSYSTATSAITSLCEVIKVQVMCLRVLKGEISLLLSLNIFYPSMISWELHVWDGSCFWRVKMIFPADSNQNNSTADMKYSSDFYFPSGHWALWWFNSNLRDPTTGFIFLLQSTSWGKSIGLGSDCTPPLLWPINTDQDYFFDLLYLLAMRCRLQNSKKMSVTTFIRLALQCWLCANLWIAHRSWVWQKVHFWE